MLTDPIADYLTRIRNAILRKYPTVEVPASNMKKAITEILKEEGYIEDYELLDDNKQGIIKITLKYEDGVPAISGLKRVSKPGLRQYSTVEKLPKVLNGLGIAIISTSKGVMTDSKARSENVGGEVLCYIW